MRHAIISVAILALLFLTSYSNVFVQDPDFESILRFEGAQEGEALRGWELVPAEAVHFESTIVHGGSGAVRLERDTPRTLTTIQKRLPVTFSGQSVELRGYLRTDGVSEFARLFLSQFGHSGRLRHDVMPNRGVRGTTGWTEYTIRVPLDEKANELRLGVLMYGKGILWADDLQLLVDGKPLDEAPYRNMDTILDTDQEFSDSSRITAASLTETQAEHVAVLGRVWGFLKYHHPRVAAGELHWDFELFRVMPEVLDAADRDDLNRILAQWVDDLGAPVYDGPRAKAPEDAHLLPQLDWIRDAELLGPSLSSQLQSVYKNRFSDDKQFYLQMAPGVGNPVFTGEQAYAGQQPPDPGFRILALLRVWNIIEYWFPYRDQLEDDWPSVLREFLPRFVAAEDWDAYRLELLAFIAHVHDTHANLWGQVDVRPPRGNSYWPVEIRFIEGRATVTAFTDEIKGPASGLLIGDVIETVDGQTVESLFEAWSPYYPASNKSTRLADVVRYLPRGESGPSKLTIDRRGQPLTVSVSRIAPGRRRIPRDRPGETFQLLSPDVAYLKLSSVRVSDIDSYLEQASGTRGLVIDIRNYPSESVVYSLGGRFVQEQTPFARFTAGDINNPGAFTWGPTVAIQPGTPRYEGKVAILVDEVSISHAEFTAMALRAGPQAVVVGSTTAGADGNVSPIPLPGGLRTLISGIGVFYPDKTPTQRVGIVADIPAAPTIAGIRDGRDEVLEAALRHILGPDADEDMIRKMARRPDR